jgi:phosphate starvation-inducible protein PhoH and related proteins
LTEITIPLRSHDEAVLVLGPYDRYAKLLRQDLAIELFTRRGNLRIKGTDESVQEARRRIEHLLGKKRKGRELTLNEIEAILLGTGNGSGAATGAGSDLAARAGPGFPAERGLQDGRGRPGYERAEAPAARGALRIAAVQPRTENQRRYLDMIEKNTLVFGLGVAGTGKTFLAVTAAVRAMRAGLCKRLVITRPVVEAGERLGFLPGDVQAKLNPYTRPIYDALHDLIGFDDVSRMEEVGVIEVAPLAFMRGRTLAQSFVILDEAQNTTIAQMKMFLTRLGEGSSMVVTGDPTQTDLDGAQKSGLLDAVRRLRGFTDVGVCEFTHRDIVRHPLVERIVRAYGGPARPEAGRERPDRPERLEPPPPGS